MDKLPARFTYGITKVELLARVGDVGHPFGAFYPADKSIRIYSVPLGNWLVKNEKYAEEFYKRRGALTEANGESLCVYWQDPDRLRFEICHTLLHECGHHYDYQYRCRRPLPRDRDDHERSAEAHAFRMTHQRCLREMFPHLAIAAEEPPHCDEAAR